MDPALFAWTLMENCAHQFHEVEGDSDSAAFDASAVVDAAFNQLVQDRVVAAGSSTVAAVMLNRATSELQVANLGDSAVAVVRGHDFLTKSCAKTQQHFFNAPYQLAVRHIQTDKDFISDTMAK